MTILKHIPGDGNGTPSTVSINLSALTVFFAALSVIAVIWIGVTGASERKQSRIDDLTVRMLKDEIESNRVANTEQHGIILSRVDATIRRLDSMEEYMRVNSLSVRAR